MRILNRLSLLSLALLIALPAAGLASHANATNAAKPATPIAVKPDPKASREAFIGIAKVLRDPRCMNCHTVTDFPRQADDRHRHHQMVMRGKDNKGIAPMLCANCHQAKNSNDGKIPGAPHWQLAPLSMAWEHLKTDKALCEAVVDRKKNGDRDTGKIVTHMLEDALVQWAWEPGDRKPPAISQEEFHALVKLWASTGAACPK